jgi:hypothetical protein
LRDQNRQGFGRMRREGELLIAGAGAPIARVARWAAGLGLSGLEFSEGIPGQCRRGGDYECRCPRFRYQLRIGGGSGRRSERRTYQRARITIGVGLSNERDPHRA